MTMDDRTRVRAESGVRELIRRLEEEGVGAGREQAARLLADADARAARIIADAEREAARLSESARLEAAAQSEAAREALRLAYRDTLHVLKEELGEVFAQRLRRYVGESLRDPELLARLLEHTVRQLDTTVEVRLADGVATRTLQASLPESEVEQATADIVRELLADGLALGATRTSLRGLHVRLAGEDIELDLDEATLARLLQSFLAPRFRSALDGLPGAG